MNGKKIKMLANVVFEDQNDMAEKLGIGQSTVSEAMNGKKNLPYKAIELLVNNFDIDGNWLIANDNDYQIRFRKHAKSYEELERKYILLLEDSATYSKRLKNNQTVFDET
jgi:transcriptional regulator with XRE-family HTH domain